MNERTKIERVGGHLLVDDRDIVSIHGMGISRHFDVDFAEITGRITLISDHGSADVEGWTAREVLEVAYGPKESPEWWEPRPFITEPSIPECKALMDIGVMAQMKTKDEEIAVLREALRRVLGHYIDETRNGDGIDEDSWDDVAASMVLAKVEGPRFEEPAIERGLASIHEAAKVGR